MSNNRNYFGKKEDTFKLGWGVDQSQNDPIKQHHPLKPKDNFSIGWGGVHKSEMPKNTYNPHNFEVQQDSFANNQRIKNKQRNQGNNIFGHYQEQADKEATRQQQLQYQQPPQENYYQQQQQPDYHPQQEQNKYLPQDQDYQNHYMNQQPTQQFDPQPEFTDEEYLRYKEEYLKKQAALDFHHPSQPQSHYEPHHQAQAYYEPQYQAQVQFEPQVSYEPVQRAQQPVGKYGYVLKRDNDIFGQNQPAQVSQGRNQSNISKIQFGDNQEQQTSSYSAQYKK